ncbi:hypothetical protein HanPSC8_Chr03g0118361 [Helianthus annuus]|nr:hypothetical protein HanPSC8_Chr03g0118361 [Helianthus annuus]
MRRRSGSQKIPKSRLLVLPRAQYVTPDWTGFQPYPHMSLHGFMASSPQAHHYMCVCVGGGGGPGILNLLCMDFQLISYLNLLAMIMVF